MSDVECKDPGNLPKWGFMDLAAWKLVPEMFGGGRAYIQRFKDAWVRHNKRTIIQTAHRLSMPPQLLAGVCWIEVGGDPNVIDDVAFGVRSFDWSGGPAIDLRTVTKNPTLTSFGSVSIQLRVAAETLGLDASKMSYSELRTLATCIEQDTYNIEVVAKHLRQLINHDKFQQNNTPLTMDQVRVVGARYNRGAALSLEKIKKNTSYGDFIVKFWPRFTGLLEL
ncbi:MAG TPA: hypothetical protein VJV78_16845 [Polyangiales bacterium]|nr:hypothetical protein [Polyangiales bacterium]